MVAINAIAAILGIVILAGWALQLGYDGIIYLTAIGIISGLGGYPVLKEIYGNYGHIAHAIQEWERKKGGGLA